MNVQIVKKSITGLPVDAIVNAANKGLQAGGGVCGAIFAAAGYQQLQAACDRIGHCDTGKAVITPGFALPAKYIIHTVGPIWQGGTSGEEELLVSCYVSSLELASSYGVKTIAFPLISAGIFGVPIKTAWRAAGEGIEKFEKENPASGMEVTFACLDDRIIYIGREILGIRE